MSASLPGSIVPASNGDRFLNSSNLHHCIDLGDETDGEPHLFANERFESREFESNAVHAPGQIDEAIRTIGIAHSCDLFDL